MRESKLTEHIFKKGKFITPFNSIMTTLLKEKSWSYGRIPEYLWLGLIINGGERSEQMEKCLNLLKRLNEIDDDNTLDLPKISSIFKMKKHNQVLFFSYMEEIQIMEHLKPLSVILSGQSQVFDYYLKGYSESIVERVQSLNSMLEILSSHQSNLSTDIRFLVIYNFSLSGKLIINSDSSFPSNLNDYPYLSHEDVEMRILRPNIRAMELAFVNLGEDEDDLNFIETFWKKISLLTECEEFYVSNTEESLLNLNMYKKYIHDILEYYNEIFKNTRPLDTKMLTLLGIATYSYKRLLELIDHNLEHTISGRTIVRSIIENYMMTKYLLMEETNHNDIWNDFQYYGIGQYKLIYERYAENKPTIENSHVKFKYINLIVSEFTSKEFIDMDTNYFGKGNIKSKFDSIGEGDLWRYFYDYDSQFEHGLWGAIRESSILKCDSPGHMYHGIPDVENLQQLPSVANDCVLIMNKHINLLRKIYTLPDFLAREDYYD
ncbi:hypothetical protein FQR53_03585 [Listeria monocytogenes]|nr:hypothetical protein [Listeria monocytogenes]